MSLWGSRPEQRDAVRHRLVVHGFCHLFADEPDAALTVGTEAIRQLQQNGTERSPDTMDLLAWAHRARGDAGQTVVHLEAAAVQREMSQFGTSRWRVLRSEDARRWAEGKLGPVAMAAAVEAGRSLTDLAHVPSEPSP